MKKLLLSFLLLFSFLSVKSQCTSALMITEVLTDPNSNGDFNFDTDGDDTAENVDEFVKICNSSDVGLNVSGFILNDPTIGDWFTFPADTFVPPFGCVTVVTGFDGALPPGAFSPLRGSAVINNGGDTITLFDPANVECDSFVAVAGTDGCVQSAGIEELLCSADEFSFTSSVLITPITLASFTAEIDNATAILKWTTLSEENNDVIEIQRSFNGLDWDKIGEVDGQGTTDERTDYQFEDKNLVNGTTFYQLNQIDFDGTVTLSDIVSITTDQLSDLEIGAVNKQSINLTTALEGNASYRVFNSMGEMVANGEFIAIKGNQSIYYQSGVLASGFYIIQLEVKGQSVTRKYIIQ